MWVGAVRCGSTREEQLESSRDQNKGTNMVGRREKGLLSDPGSELRLGMEEKEKRESAKRNKTKERDQQKKK